MTSKMSALRKTARKTAHGARWVGEAFSLITDHKLRPGNIEELSNEKLLSKQRSTTRCVAASATGIVVNTGLGTVCPVFLPGAAINTWQLGISSTNCHRASREIKRRADKDERFAKLYRRHLKRHMVFDVTVGATIKVAFICIGVGIAGFDNIADGTSHADLNWSHGQHIAHTIAAQNVGHATANNSYVDAAAQHVHDRAADFKANHPKIALVDNNVHKVVGGIGDAIATQVAKHTGLVIGADTSWKDLVLLLLQGAHKGLITSQVVVVGAAQDMTAVVTQVGEVVLDSALSRVQEKRAGARCRF
jgi:hypothetical protein